MKLEWSSKLLPVVKRAAAVAAVVVVVGKCRHWQDPRQPQWVCLTIIKPFWLQLIFIMLQIIPKSSLNLVQFPRMDRLPHILPQNVPLLLWMSSRIDPLDMEPLGLCGKLDAFYFMNHIFLGFSFSCACKRRFPVLEFFLKGYSKWQLFLF